MLGGIVGLSTTTLASSASAATVLPKSICQKDDPNIVNGLCLQITHNDGTLGHTWAGTYRGPKSSLSPSGIFFCIDFMYSSSLNGTVRVMSTANIKNQFGGGVGPRAISALNYIINKWAPNGSTGSDARDAAIAIIAREIMNDGANATSGVVYPAGLIAGATVKPPKGGLAGPTMGLAQSMWDEASDYYGPWTVKLTAPAAGTMIVGKPATFKVEVVSAAGNDVPGVTLPLTCSTNLTCPASVVSQKTPRSFQATATNSAKVAMKTQIQGPDANGHLYVTNWHTHPGPYASNVAQQRGWIATKSEAAAAASVAPTAVYQPSISTTTSNATISGATALTDQLTITGSWKPGDVENIAATLYGPYPAQPTAADCQPAQAIGTVHVSANGLGTYTTPSVTTPSTAGYYVWQEVLPGNGTDVKSVTTPCGIAQETTLLSPSAPTLATQVSEQNGAIGDLIHDTINVGNTNGHTIVVDWKLWGPMAPDALGKCDTVDWSTAPVADSGSVTAAGDGTYTTTATKLAVAGCYTYSESAAATANTGATSTNPGDATETALIGKVSPEFVTQASTQNANAGDSVHDTITVSRSNGQDVVIDWQLLGPVAPINGSCTSVNWASAAILDSGTVTAHGDGDIDTPSTVLPKNGCYTYVESSAGGPNTNTVPPTPPGLPPETVLVLPHTPKFSTHVNKQHVLVGATLVDHIDVTGLVAGDVVAVKWYLYGPAAPKGSTCAGIDWAKAKVFRSGTVIAHGNGSIVTPAVKVTTAGCYTYAEKADATSTTNAGGTLPGISVETSLVTKPPVPHIPPVPTGGVGGGNGADGAGTVALGGGSDDVEYPFIGGMAGLALFGTALVVRRRKAA